MTGKDMTESSQREQVHAGTPWCSQNKFHLNTTVKVRFAYCKACDGHAGPICKQVCSDGNSLLHHIFGIAHMLMPGVHEKDQMLVRH